MVGVPPLVEGRGGARCRVDWPEASDETLAGGGKGMIVRTLPRETLAAAQQSAGGFTVVSEDGTADEGIENLVRQRAEAKKAKNFAEADRIRDELKTQGVEVTDMPGGAKWKRV